MNEQLISTNEKETFEQADIIIIFFKTDDIITTSDPYLSDFENLE